MEIRIRIGSMYIRDITTDPEDVLTEFMHSVVLTSNINKAVVYDNSEKEVVEALIHKLYVVLGVKSEIVLTKIDELEG